MSIDKDTLVKRLKALAWSVGMMAVAMAIDFLLNNIGLFNLPADVTVFLGLILAQVSKWLNSEKASSV